MKTIENIFVYLLQLGLLTCGGLLLYMFIISVFGNTSMGELRELLLWVIKVFLCTVVVAIIGKLVIHE